MHRLAAALPPFPAPLTVGRATCTGLVGARAAVTGYRLMK
ncbi:MAG: hypothetical protein NVS4B2_30750 [Chloroflexota bacterium]